MAGSDTLAKTLMTSLLAGDALTVPSVDFTGDAYQLPDGTGPLYAPVTALALTDLTTKVVGGTGVFDTLMTTYKVHLKEEHEKGRLTGAEYGKVYIALSESAMSHAVQFLLARDQTYWQTLTAQLAAQTAEVQLVTAKVANEGEKMKAALASFEAQTARAAYALTKLKLATESAGYDTASYQLSTLLPAQKLLLAEQMQQARAQTVDTRQDGTPVQGVMAKQMALLEQQTTSYKRDAEVKAAKMFVDAWITQKTIDDATEAPPAFLNSNLDAIMTAIRTANGL